MKLTLTFIATLLLLQMPAFAQDGTRGGHGDDGLDYRLATAKNLAIESLRSLYKKLAIERITGIQSTTLDHTQKDMIEFFQKNDQLLLEEIDLSNILVRPEKEVQTEVGGKSIPRKACTGLTQHSDILINREANLTTPVAELTAILLHEIGHHTGLADESEMVDESDKALFLNRFAIFLLEQASKENDFFQAQLYGNKSIYQLIDPEKRKGFSSGSIVDHFFNAYEFSVWVDLFHQTITFQRSRINDSIFPWVNTKGGPQTVEQTILIQGPLTPEIIAQFYEKDLNQITVNSLTAIDPKDKTQYQIILNFENHQLTAFSVVPLKDGLPNFKKAKTYVSFSRSRSLREKN